MPKTLEWLWSEQSKVLKQKKKLIVGFRAENAIGIFGMQIAQEFNRLLMLTGLCIQWCAKAVIALTVTKTVEGLLTGFSTQTRRGRPLISYKSAVYNHKTGLCIHKPRRRQRVEMIYSDLAGYSCTKRLQEMRYIKLFLIFK